LTYQFSAFTTARNSTFGVEVNSEASSCRALQIFKEFGYLTLAIIYLVSSLITTEKSILRVS